MEKLIQRLTCKCLPQHIGDPYVSCRLDPGQGNVSTTLHLSRETVTRSPTVLLPLTDHIVPRIRIRIRGVAE